MIIFQLKSVKIGDRANFRSKILAAEEGMCMQGVTRDTLETIMDFIPAGIILIKKNGEITHINHRAKIIFGFDPCGLKFSDYSAKQIKLLTLGRDQYPSKQLSIIKVLLSGLKLKDELIIERPDNSRIIISVTAIPIKNENGKIIAAVLIVEDISQRKKAEDALKCSESRFHALFKSSIDAVILSSQDGQIFSANPAACKMFGMTKKELQKAGRSGIVILNDNTENINYHIKENQKVKSELIFKRKDGTTFEGEAVSCLFTDTDGTVKTSIIIRDLSNRKKTQQKITQQHTIQQGIKKIFQESLSRRTEEALGELCLSVAQEITKSKFGFIGEIRQKGLYKIAINNSGWTKCSKIKSKGHNKSVGNFKVHSLYGKVINDGKGFFTNDPTNHNASTRLPYGHPPLTSFLGVPLIGEGKTVGIITLGNRDGGYSENDLEALEALAPSVVEAFLRKRAEVKLEDYSRHLEELIEERTKKLREVERFAAIGQTAGMVGHDLRNPLQAIIGEVYLAKRELKLLPEGEQKSNLQESIDAIADQIGYMDKIVSDLQTFVKPIEAHRQIINIKEFITSIILRLNVPTTIDVLLQAEDNLLNVNADPQLLKRVLINLITNAMQAMPKGGKLTIQVKANTPANVEIIVEDTGVGIPDEIKPKIFTPLFTTKSKGQGFGLAVCRRVLEAQGGTIIFESQKGKGTKFKVNLPAQKQTIIS